MSLGLFGQAARTFDGLKLRMVEPLSGLSARCFLYFFILKR